MVQEPHSPSRWSGFAVLVGTAILTSLPVHASSAPPIDVPHRTVRIAVDGDVDEWRETGQVLSLLPSSPNAPDSPAPWSSIAWDREALYLAFQVEDDDLVSAGPQTGVADPFAVDRVELRVDMDGGGGALGPGDVRVLLGCDGTVAVYRGAEPTADGRTVLTGVGPVAGLLAAVERGTAGYAAELAIPFSLLDVEAPGRGRTLSVAVVSTDVQGGAGELAGLESGSWSVSGRDDDTWSTLSLAGGPGWRDRLGPGTHPWLAALLAALLATVCTAAAFLWRQRRIRTRFDALAARLEEIERTSAPSLQLVLADEASTGGPSLTISPTATASLSLTASASLITVLRTGFTVLPFDQAAKDLAGRIQELEDRAEDAVGATEWQALAEMALAYLKLHVPDNTSVAELARALHMTSRTLQRGVRRALDCTPRELIQTVKMTEAKRLLKTGVHRVSDVGYMVGFEDPGHFSRRFKAYFGCTPSALVARYRDAQARETSG